MSNARQKSSGVGYGAWARICFATVDGRSRRSVFVRLVRSSPSRFTRHSSRSWASRITRQASRISIALLFILVGTTAFAQSKDCVSLKTEVQMEENYTDAQGKPAKRLVAPKKIIPGNEVIYTITATNSCNKPAEKVVVNNAVPEHMVYVADSAMGPGAEITFSLNGKDFQKLSELAVRDADGKSRAASGDDIKAIRWVIGAAIAPNQMAFVRYRARVK